MKDVPAASASNHQRLPHNERDFGIVAGGIRLTGGLINASASRDLIASSSPSGGS